MSRQANGAIASDEDGREICDEIAIQEVHQGLMMGVGPDASAISSRLGRTKAKAIAEDRDATLQWVRDAHDNFIGAICDNTFFGSEELGRSTSNPNVDGT